MQRSTTTAWHRNVARIQSYAARLDQASDRRGLLAAIRWLARRRPSIERDNVRINEGLLRLGAPVCRIAPPIPTSTITLRVPRSALAGAKGRSATALTPGRDTLATYQ